jgi:hypothetical protein
MPVHLALTTTTMQALASASRRQLFTMLRYLPAKQPLQSLATLTSSQTLTARAVVTAMILTA